jgi:hypothetical protein
MFDTLSFVLKVKFVAKVVIFEVRRGRRWPGYGNVASGGGSFVHSTYLLICSVTENREQLFLRFLTA